LFMFLTIREGVTGMVNNRIGCIILRELNILGITEKG